MRNIILVVVDCLRADRLAGLGSCRTPILDQLRGQGVTFTQAIASNTLTTPSFANLMTGCYSTRHGVRNLLGVKLDSSLPTLAGLLKELGYYTVAEVTGPLMELTGLNRGFDEYHFRSENEYLNGEWGQNLLKKLRERGWPQPFFLLLHLWELHLERQMVEGFNHRRYGDNRYDRSLSSLDSQLGLLLEMGEADILVVTGDHGETFPENRWHEAATFLRWDALRMVRKVTGKLGWDWPRQQKRWGHGEGLGLPEALIRVPMVIVAPDLAPEGVEVDHLVRHIDLLPTLLDLAGGLDTWRPKGQGVSLKPLWEGGQVDIPSVFLDSAHTVRAVEGEGDYTVGLRTSSHKLVVQEGETEQARLWRVDSAGFGELELERPESKVVEGLQTELAELLAQRGEIEAPKMDSKEGALLEARLKDLGYL